MSFSVGLCLGFSLLGILLSEPDSRRNGRSVFSWASCNPCLICRLLICLNVACFILQPRCFVIPCRFHHEQHVSIFFLSLIFFIGNATSTCSRKGGCVKNHFFDCMIFFNGIATGTGLKWLHIFAFFFLLHLILIEFMSPFSYFFNLKSLLSTNVSQEYQVTEMPHFVFEYELVFSLFLQEKKDSPFGKQWQTLTKLSCCALFSSTGWKFPLR